MGPSGACIRGWDKGSGYLYMHVTKTKTYSCHRLIWEAFHGLIPTGLQIDHIDGDKSNNKLKNLSMLSPAEHAAKTSQDHPTMATKTARHKMVKVARMTNGQKVIFDSQSEAARATPSAWQQHISKCLAGILTTHAGYSWQAVAEETENLGDWVSLRDADLRGLQVSSQGWVKGRNGVPFRGSLLAGYYVVKIRGKAYRVHRLICLAFHGHSTDPLMTVDHIDRNPANNTATNLRWATGIEQAANKRKRCLT